MNTEVTIIIEVYTDPFGIADLNKVVFTLQTTNPQGIRNWTKVGQAANERNAINKELVKIEQIARGLTELPIRFEYGRHVN